jgi:hypothetical protein
MKKPLKEKAMLATLFLMCAVVGWLTPTALEASEFSGGWLTGRVLKINSGGRYIFILAFVLAFLFRRIAAGIAIVASLISLPLYLFLVAPGLSRRVLGGNYSVLISANFVWDNYAVLGILTIALAVYVCIRSLSSRDADRRPEPLA